MSVLYERDRAKYVVRWREDGGQRARRFAAEAEAETLGIIANELIANAARHGRPPISVRLTLGDPARLDVRDAGRATAPAADGLGLRLVRQVTEHGLHGTFALDPDPDGGTGAHVRFPLVNHASADR